MIKKQVDSDYVTRLCEHITLPDNVRFILNGFSELHSLGVGMKNGEVVVRLCVREATVAFPSHIDFEGQKVPIDVITGWQIPSPH